MYFLTSINFDNTSFLLWWSVTEHLFTKPEHTRHRLSTLAPVTVSVWADKHGIEMGVVVNLKQQTSHGIMNLVDPVHAPQPSHDG